MPLGHLIGICFFIFIYLFFIFFIPNSIIVLKQVSEFIKSNYYFVSDQRLLRVHSSCYVNSKGSNQTVWISLCYFHSVSIFTLQLILCSLYFDGFKDGYSVLHVCPGHVDSYAEFCMKLNCYFLLQCTVSFCKEKMQRRFASKCYSVNQSQWTSFYKKT